MSKKTQRDLEVDKAIDKVTKALLSLGDQHLGRPPTIKELDRALTLATGMETRVTKYDPEEGIIEEISIALPHPIDIINIEITLEGEPV